MSTNQSQSNFTEFMTTYFKGVKSEWGKISWPERRVVVAQTIVVLIVVIFFALFVLLIDFGFKWLFSLIPGG
jgi:preprotein translocase subunit SecE